MNKIISVGIQVLGVAAVGAIGFVVGRHYERGSVASADATYYTAEDLAKVADAWRESYNELMVENSKLRGAKDLDELVEESQKAMSALEEDDVDTYLDLTQAYGSENLKTEDTTNVINKNAKPAYIISSVEYFETPLDGREILKWWEDGILTDEDDGRLVDSVFLTPEVKERLAGDPAVTYICVPRYNNRKYRIERQNDRFYDICMCDPEWQERHPDDCRLYGDF